MEGVSSADAIGSLILAFGESMGIEINYPDENRPPAFTIDGVDYKLGDKIEISVGGWSDPFYSGQILGINLEENLFDFDLVSCTGKRIRYTGNFVERKLNLTNLFQFNGNMFINFKIRKA